MASQNEEKDLSQQTQDVAEKAKAASSAVKAAGKAAMGDMAGAAVEIVKNKTLRNAVIGSLLLFSILIVGVASYIGSAITGAAEDLIQTFAENYDEAWTQQGIASAGSSLYFHSFSSEQLEYQALGATIQDAISDVLASVNTNTVNGEDATNSSLSGADIYDADDAEQTLEALQTEEAMTGAIKRRLDMIKSRVAQRGEQIKSAATSQYSMQTIGNAAASVLQNFFSNPILFAGIDFDACSLNVNVDAFDLTDTQALKILCAFSTQYDAALTSADMWSLMDYCGWFGYTQHELPSEDLESNSIYETSVASAYMGGSIEGVVSGGTDMTSYMAETTYYDPLTVPYWSGTFVPQWALEEKAQIQKHNDHYWDLVEKGAEITAEDALWGTQASRTAAITGFEKLDAVEPYGIIDKLFRSSMAQMTITPVEFHGYSEIPRELLQGLWDDAVDAWENFFTPPEPVTYYDTSGNYITESSITHYASEGTFVLRKNGTIIGTKTVSGGSVTFSGLHSSTQYSLYLQVRMGPSYAYQLVGTVTTAAPAETNDTVAESYQLDIDINIAFSALSIDELISNTIGLWSGNLHDTEETATGIYQKGEAENPLLLYEWTDSYTDASGVKQELTFTRQKGFQAEAYRDNVFALGKDILPEEEYRALTSFSGVSRGFGTGRNIVAAAQAEYASDHGVLGGDKYWFAYCDFKNTSHVNSGIWSTCFVYYCACQSGFLGSDGCFGSEWRISVSSSWNYFREKGLIYTSDTYVPEAGDLIYFGSDPSQTGQAFTGMGIVEYVEDGIVHTIEGDCMDTVDKRSGECKVGTKIGSAYIEGYAKPDYPDAAETDYLFTAISGPLQPSIFAMLVGQEPNTVILAGIPRFSTAQVQGFVNQLSRQDPDFAALQEVAALITAVRNSADSTQIVNAWNTVAISYPDQFQTLQTDYAMEAILPPIAQQIQHGQEFSWGKTAGRMDILWAITTATPYTNIATQVLMELSDGLDDNATDWMVTHTYSEKIQTIIEEYGDSLWLGYDEQTRAQWEKTLLDLVPLMEEAYPQVSYASGSKAEIQNGIFNFCRDVLGLNTAAACGVLANIQAESDFNLRGSGDYGTSFGLCQWHNERWSSLVVYCQNSSLDPYSLEGQMQYLKYELETSQNNVYQKLKGAENTLAGAGQAAYDWCVYFEIPADKIAKGLERGRIAKEVYWPVFSSGQSMALVDNGWRRPIDSYTRISSRYGNRSSGWHNGLDFAAPAGTPIFATRSGTVKDAKSLIDSNGNYYSYGNYVRIDHGGGITSVYAHMTSYIVSEGDYVLQGQVIGYVGSTGNSTGNHLHFTMEVNGRDVDPENYITP